MASRDRRFDGRFVVAVTSTGVYCRPSCPSRTPRRENSRFFRLPAAAEAAGFRACRRCRPEAGPSSPEWNVRGDLVARALSLIAGGAVDEGGVRSLARRLAVSERHLHRQLVAEVGVGAQMLAISRRARVARMLIESTALPMTDVAFAAGYSSVRQFNDGMRATFGCAPSELRGTRSPDAQMGTGELVLRLRHRTPLPARPLLDWFAARALGGVETVEDGCYVRTMRLPHGCGLVAAELAPVADGQAALAVRFTLADPRDVTAAVQRCRELFDLDADPAAIDDDLGCDPVVGPLVRARPGLRVPGCADGFELAVRAVLGQQVSLAAARTFGTRLVIRFGAPRNDLGNPFPQLTHLFPTPDALAEADLASIGLTKRRAATLRALAKAVCLGELVLDSGADRAECVAALCALTGVGPWTAGYIAMRALRDPDVFLHTDLGLVEAARHHGVDDGPRALQRCAERWRPWRSYAAMHLWASLPPRSRRNSQESTPR
ncbi:helix-turn-helix domain-containing protein [Saccharopolyspora sp. K220]|uniref:DNA-3-methyladenine glycosylase 2 family protein n=1 Tax=Saccharopolyspora soli TaxID=2926618 RepID=UPI001F5A8341|nr:AlkA N-terminal domain-containing protein [Saccharopolyspora soli]MCI2416799.1 helix-turn-helix domain-containing protein [Saccharopolyspora soli]